MDILQFVAKNTFYFVLKYDLLKIFAVKYFLFNFDFLDSVKDVKNLRADIPQYLDCNRKRFPHWFGDTDPRNSVFRNIIQSFVVENQIEVNTEEDCQYLLRMKYIPLLDFSNFGKLPICPLE